MKTVEEIKKELKRIDSDLKTLAVTIEKADKANDDKTKALLDMVYVDLFSQRARLEALLKLFS